jgi:hypothetical protein
MVFRKMDRKKKTDMARRVVTHCQIVVQKLIFGNESLNPHRKPVEPRAKAIANTLQYTHGSKAGRASGMSNLIMVGIGRWMMVGQSQRAYTEDSIQRR